MKPKLLITGATGMVGRNILEKLDEDSWDVLKPTSSELDLQNANAVERYLQKEMPQAVIHTAGLVGGIESNLKYPVEYLDTNNIIGRNVIVSSWRAGIKTLLNLGSSCMYPRGVDGTLKEDMILSAPLEPTNEGYALAKIMSAKLCEYIHREDSSFQYKTIIPCNLYGRYDKFEPNRSHLIPAIIHKVHMAKMNGDTQIDIWGDGTARREFMYAGDLADAVLKAKNDMAGVPSLMNCGAGVDYEVNYYYQCAAEIIDWEGRFSHDLSKPTGMKRKLCDVSRQEQWGWRPKTDLIDGIKLTYQYYLNKVTQ